MSYHQFADDTLLYIATNAAETAPTLDRLARCTAAVKQWFLLSDLQLNSDKSEVVVFGTTAQLQSIASVKTVDIAGCSLPVKCTVKSLGVILDSHFNFDSHAKSVVATCNSHTHARRHIRKVLSQDVAKTIACSIVSARLDYCNALLRGAPATTIDKLQRAQDTLAGVVTKSTRQTPSRPLLCSVQSLHWLPVREHIDYKVALLAYKVQTTSIPSYLDSLLYRHISTRCLRSTDDALRLVVPRTRTELARRAFSASAPSVWIGLPDSDSIRLRKTVPTFKKHYFSRAFVSP